MSLLILPIQGTGTVWVLFSDRGMCVGASPAAPLHRERKELGLWVQTLETSPRAWLLGLCPGSGDLGWAEHSTRLGGAASILGGVFFLQEKVIFSAKMKLSALTVVRWVCSQDFFQLSGTTKLHQLLSDAWLLTPENVCTVSQHERGNL